MSLSSESWVLPKTWHKLEDQSIDLMHGDSCLVGIDVGIYRDSTVITFLKGLTYADTTDTIRQRLVAVIRNDRIDAHEEIRQSLKRLKDNKFEVENCDLKRRTKWIKNLERVQEDRTQANGVTVDCLSRVVPEAVTGMYWFCQRFYTPDEFESVKPT
jgi:phage terminase large subunit-like protein